MSDLTAVAALSPATSIAGPGASGLPHQVPGLGDVAEFARAAGLSPPEQIQALPPPSEVGLSQTIAHGFEGFIQRVHESQQAFETGSHAAPAAAPGSGVQETIQRSIGGMQSAYAFAIETTMASRGSTETTKVFNTLLKGQ